MLYIINYTLSRITHVYRREERRQLEKLKRERRQGEWRDTWRERKFIGPRCKKCGTRLEPKSREGFLLCCDACWPEHVREREEARVEREIRRLQTKERKLNRWERTHNLTISATFPSPVKDSKNARKHAREKKQRAEKRKERLRRVEANTISGSESDDGTDSDEGTQPTRTIGSVEWMDTLPRVAEAPQQPSPPPPTLNPQ